MGPKLTEALRPVAAIQLMQAGVVVTPDLSLTGYPVGEGRFEAAKATDNRLSSARLPEECKTLHHALPPYFLSNRSSATTWKPGRAL